MLEVRDISFSYGEQPILRGVSFVVSPGEVVCLVGANGSGKTTLMRILANLMFPDAGAIIVDGQNALDRPLRYRRQIGYLSSPVCLYEDMTVQSYLRYRALMKGEPERRVRKRLAETAELCGLSADILPVPIQNLSAGLAKRVALVDALLLRPRILLLDDLLSGQDDAFRTSIGEVLAQAASFSSVIVTGHELAESTKWVTRFLTLRAGKVSSAIDTAGAETSAVVTRVEQELGGPA